MKPELKKGHRWLREGEIIRKGDWFYIENLIPMPVGWSIGSRIGFGSVKSFSRRIRKRTKK